MLQSLHNTNSLMGKQVWATPFSISDRSGVALLHAHIPASMIDNRQESKSIQPPSCPHYSTALCYSRRQATEILNSHEQGAMQERCQMERMCRWCSHLPEHTHTLSHAPFHGKCVCVCEVARGEQKEHSR